MKCLSISQPFADLVISGKKTIDLRSWNTKFRGEILVHAPLKIREYDCKRLRIDETGLRTGVIIGKVEIYDVKKYHSLRELKKDSKKHFADKDYFDKRYGFLLRNPRPLNIPIPYKGMLGFFDAKIQSFLTRRDIQSDLFEEEYRYQWVGKH